MSSPEWGSSAGSGRRLGHPRVMWRRVRHLGGSGSCRAGKAGLRCGRVGPRPVRPGGALGSGPARCRPDGHDDREPGGTPVGGRPTFASFHAAGTSAASPVPEWPRSWLPPKCRPPSISRWPGSPCSPQHCGRRPRASCLTPTRVKARQSSPYLVATCFPSGHRVLRVPRRGNGGTAEASESVARWVLRVLDHDGRRTTRRRRVADGVGVMIVTRVPTAVTVAAFMHVTGVPTPIVGIAVFAVIGLGVSAVVPLAWSSAARKEAEVPGRAIATCGYLGFLVCPVPSAPWRPRSGFARRSPRRACSLSSGSFQRHRCAAGPRRRPRRRARDQATTTLGRPRSEHRDTLRAAEAEDDPGPGTPEAWPLDLPRRRRARVDVASVTLCA